MNTYTAAKPTNNDITIKLLPPRDYYVPAEGTYLGMLDEVCYTPSKNTVRFIFRLPPQGLLKKTYHAARPFELTDSAALTLFLDSWLGAALPLLTQSGATISLSALQSLVGHPASLYLVLIKNPRHPQPYRHIEKIGPAPTTPSATQVSSPSPGHQPYPGAAGKTTVSKRKKKKSSPPMAGEGDEAIPF